jgi:adenylate cyclase class 2
MKIEREIKIRIEEKNTLVPVLVKLGANLIKERHFEDNYLFDFSDKRLSKSDSLLRVRLVGGRGLLTFKKKVEGEGRIAEREELEVTFEEGATLLAIFERLGFGCFFRYQKYRTLYRAGDLEIMIDELPLMGTFVELEGSRTGIRAFAARLGFREEEFIVENYLALFKTYRAEKDLDISDLVFDR